jgi:hypothetical protein
MALEWLDAARFADTHGYQVDPHRDMWPWRDWVIDAYNRNMPFDQFTIEQLAGDLLPNATREQKIATGFNRNHRINFEGGSIEEEFRVEYVVDRANSTASVWLGLTMGCARCHDHKYDPISQTDFYRLFAFFNSVDEQGLDGRKGNAAPFLKLYTPEQEQALSRLHEQIKRLESRLSAPDPQLDQEQAAWGTRTEARLKSPWTVAEPIVYATLAKLDDQSLFPLTKTQEPYEIVVRCNLPEIQAIRLEVFAAPDDFVLSEIEIEGAKLASANAYTSHPGSRAFRAIDGKPKTSWAPGGGNHVAAFFPETPIHASELKIRLYQNNLGKFRISMSPVRPPPINISNKVAEILAAGGDRAPLREYYRRTSVPEMRKVYAELVRLRNEERAIVDGAPSTMIMQDLPTPRETFVLNRGQYDQPREKVVPGTPACLPPFPKDAPRNRLGLARWLVGPAAPLTARVAVNRM